MTLGLDIINEKGESFDIIVDGEILLESELGELNSKTFKTNAFFMQTQYAFSKNLNLFFGSRYTDHNEFDNRLTSQLTTKYSLENNHFRLNVGQGYRTPNIYELYYDWNHYDAFEIKGNPLLEPENSLNISFSYQKLSDKWNFMILLQRNMIDNMIAERRDENGNFYYENYDKTSVNSIETNVGIESNNINYELNYNFTRMIDEIEYKRLPDISEHVINLNIYSSGFLTGSIDQVFADNSNHEIAKWWVLDWKSNWIGSPLSKEHSSSCGPSNYSISRMDEEMYHHHYPLQAHIYLLALHRFLNWRLPDYSPQKHLGGYIYVFLRGLPDKEELEEKNFPQRTPGLIVEPAPIERIKKLDMLIKRQQKRISKLFSILLDVPTGTVDLDTITV